MLGLATKANCLEETCHNGIRRPISRLTAPKTTEAVNEQSSHEVKPSIELTETIEIKLPAETPLEVSPEEVHAMREEDIEHRRIVEVKRIKNKDQRRISTFMFLR